MNYNRNHAPRIPFSWPLGLLALLLLYVTSTAQAAGPTGLLNDTGQATCYDGSAMVACSAANSGNTAPYPRQDGRFGRDIASPPKVGGGAAGFDFTKVCMNGTLNCSGGANTGASPAATDWACTKDNLTNLIWSMQTQGTVSWSTVSTSSYPDAGHNSLNRCGFNSGWRLPTLRELLGIVHNGLSTAPSIDANYFPGTQSLAYWTSDTSAYIGGGGLVVRFDGGFPDAGYKTGSNLARLVRSGQ